MAFESVPWKSGNTPAFYLMQTLMELGKTDLMRDNDFVDSSSAINSHFTDSGLFGMSIEGPGSHSAELLSTMLEQLNSLREPIPDGQLAKVLSTPRYSSLAIPQYRLYHQPM